MTTLVSIITPSYNAKEFISATIKSVQKQTYTNWEHIIIDDASTDETTSIIEEYSKEDPRIILIKNQHNNGAAYCRNQATEIAKGSYIAFLDSDDLWHPNKLEKQLDFMKSADNSVSFTSYLHIDEKGKTLNKRIVALPLLSFKKQFRNNYIGNLTGIYNAGVLGKIIAPNLRKRQDWAVWLEAIKRNNKPAIGLQEDLAYYRIRKDSMSANKLNLIKYNYQFYNKYLGHSIVTSFYYLLRFLFEYFFVRPKQIQKID